MSADASATHALDEPRGSFTELDRFRLFVRRGVDQGKELTSIGERTTIGTHPSCDFVLSDPTVSRFHCEIVVTPSAIEVRDSNSLNGTRINGVSVLHAHAPPAAILQLGNTELSLEPRGDKLQLPLSERTSLGRMVGRSPAMRRIFSLLERAAASDASVLLEGETGTGKEIAAEAIHAASARQNGPFVVVDCSAVPTQLLESELFGHERGAFTGATAARSGAFELAQGGTIFLDEIGELSLDLQPKLLRVLERKQIKRVGGARYESADVRVIAATNRNLRSEVNEKRFRSDLYFRLAVIEVRLPPLRERSEDIPILVERLLETLGAAGSAEAEALKRPELMTTLGLHPWPGNVRELRNYLDRCLTLREALPIAGAEPPAQTPAPESGRVLPLKLARARWSRAFERQYLVDLLAKHDGNVSAAARVAEVDRMYLYRLLWRHGLR